MSRDDLRRRALDNLRRAVEEAGPELSHSWYAKGDPDFNVFRADPARKRPEDPEWTELMERLAPRGGTAKPSIADSIRQEAAAAERAGPAKRAAAAPPDEPGARTVAVPKPPLGPPRPREVFWALVALAIAGVVFFVGTAIGVPWWLALPVAVLLAARSAYRALIARWETRTRAAAAGDQTAPDPGPTPRRPPEGS